MAFLIRGIKIANKKKNLFVLRFETIIFCAFLNPYRVFKAKKWHQPTTNIVFAALKFSLMLFKSTCEKINWTGNVKGERCQCWRHLFVCTVTFFVCIPSINLYTNPCATLDFTIVWVGQHYFATKCMYQRLHFIYKSEYGIRFLVILNLVSSSKFGIYIISYSHSHSTWQAQVVFHNFKYCQLLYLVCKNDISFICSCLLTN